MTATVGSAIAWRRGNGKIGRMRVDLIHLVDGDVWVFGWVGTSWSAVNQKYVLQVK